MRRLLPFLVPGLLLVCCDKPESPDPRKDAAAQSTTRAPQSSSRVPSRVTSSAPHEDPTSPEALPSTPEPAPVTPAALRTIYEAAVKIKSPAVREKALADVAWNALEIDPQLAVEAFLLLPTDSAEKLRLIQHYAMRLAEQDPDEAFEWAATVGTEQEISAANGQIALVLAEIDPQRAANLLSESGIVGREFDVAVVQVIQRWAAQSSPDAAAWVVMFPPGAARETGIKIIVDQWAKADSQAAFSWMSSLQDETVRGEALLAMEEAVLQQPQSVRDAWLEHADSQARSELEQQRETAIKNVGDNIPQPTTSSSDR